MKKCYSIQEIEILGNNPHVKYVCRNRLVLTFPFRILLYEAWESSDPTNYALRKVFQEHGFDTRMLCSRYIEYIRKGFHRKGRPSGGRNKVYKKQEPYTNPAHTEKLIQSGLFIPYGRGISLPPERVADIISCSPEMTIRDYFASHGIDLETIGSSRLRNIRSRIERAGNAPRETKPVHSGLQKLEGHPYVETARIKHFRLRDAFYNEVSPLVSWLCIDEILHLFEIDSSVLSQKQKQRITYKLRSWEKNDGTAGEAEPHGQTQGNL